MPSKGKRAAARQAKVRQKRRRGKAAVQAFDTGPTEAEVTAREELRASQARAQPAAATSVARSLGRSRQAAADTAPLTYPHLGKELKRIGIMASGIFVILAAVSFVLG